VARRLREPDLAELEAVHGRGAVDPLRILRQAAALSEAPMAARRADGEPIALLGCVPVSMLTREAAPWMLGTDRMEEHARATVVLGRRECQGWAARYRLENWVDARNTTSVRWLERIGFEIHAPAPRGRLGMPFHRFTWNVLDPRAPTPQCGADHARAADSTASSPLADVHP